MTKCKEERLHRSEREVLATHMRRRIARFNRLSIPQIGRIKSSLLERYWDARVDLVLLVDGAQFAGGPHFAGQFLKSILEQSSSSHRWPGRDLRD